MVFVEVSSAQMLQKHHGNVLEGPVSFAHKPQVVVVTMMHVLIMACDHAVGRCLEMVLNQSREASSALSHLDGHTCCERVRVGPTSEAACTA